VAQNDYGRNFVTSKQQHYTHGSVRKAVDFFNKKNKPFKNL
jgi:hypothetical protein